MKQLLTTSNIIALTMILLNVSCAQEDLFNAKENAANNNPLKISTTDDFQWTTSRSLSVSVNNSKNSDFTYGIELFNENPITNPNATRIASGTSVKNTSFRTIVEQENAYDYLYARLTYSDTENEVRKISVNGNSASSNFAQKMTRSISTPLKTTNWPSRTSESNYATSATIVGMQASTNLQTGNNGSYLVNGSTSAVNLWSGTSKVYVDGYADFSRSSFYTCSNTTIYILPDATLVIPAMCLSQVNTTVYVSKGGRIVCNGNLEFGYQTRIYNRGTIEAEKLAASSNGVVFNEADGTIKATKCLSVENWESYIVNEGKITTADTHTAGSGHIQNSGEVVVSGSTIINSNDNSWQNDGMWTTFDFTYNANSHCVTNNCMLKVDNLFKIELGDGDGFFQNNGGAYVECKDLYANNSEFHLGSKSLFRITGTATFNYNRPDRGFIGAGNDYGVLEMNNAIAKNYNQGYTSSYSGNLIVACANHFAQGYSGQYPFYYMDNNVIMTDKNADFTIESSICNPGYNEQQKKEDVSIPFTTTLSNIYAFEDNWPEFGDFDMNDVIFRLNIEAIGSDKAGDSIITKAIITPTILAIGADSHLKIGIQFDEIDVENASCTNLEGNQEKAVVIFDKDITGYLNVNGEREESKFIGLSPITIEFPEGVTPSKVKLENVNVFITVNMAGYGIPRKEIHLKGYDVTQLAAQGTSNILSKHDQYCSADNFPWGICLPGSSKWKWPQEHNSIAKDNDSFIDWVTSGGVNSCTWYNN